MGWKAPLRGRGKNMYPHPAYEAWKETARVLAKIECSTKGIPCMPGPIIADFTFCFHSSSHGDGEHHLIKPDRSNCLKATEDILEGLLYFNDSQIWTGTTTKIWVKSAEKEGIIIRLNYSL